MPQKDKIELYRSITAPESLKERVLSLENSGKQKSNLGFRVIAAAAAFAVLVGSAFGYFGYAEVEVASDAQGYVEPSVYGNSPALARSVIYNETLIFDVDSNSETTVTVTVGELTVISGGEEAVQTGSDVTVSGKATLKWSVSPDDIYSGNAAVKLKTLGRTKTYIPETNGESYTLRLEK